MVLKFRLISNEQDDFIRDIEILDEQTFYHFHVVIQENLQFDKSQIASFFTCNQKWEKEQEITLFELSDEEAANVLVMDNTRLGDHILELHSKMLYVFDVFNERLFFIELMETFQEDSSKTYPYCSFEKGPAPQQVYLDSIFSAKELKAGSRLDDTKLDDEMPDNEDPDRLDYEQEYPNDSFPYEE